MCSSQVCSVINYSTDMKNIKDKKIYRMKLVNYSIEHGNKPAARYFNTTVKTVRKWRRRFEKDGYNALADECKAPKKPALFISECERAYIVFLKKRHKNMGALRLKNDYYQSMSLKAIRKIFCEEKLIKLKRKKSKTKQNLREIKKEWKFCQQICVDLKELKDIPEYFPYMMGMGLPKYQFTARDVTSGLQFIAYADEKLLVYADLFIKVLLEHLVSCGVDLSNCSIQTDNGSEFIGAWNKKGITEFTRTIEQYKMIHKTIPCSAHTWQSDVETVHRLIEDEFYEREKYKSESDFLNKIGSYLLYFNSIRKNSYKENQSPWEIIKKKVKNISPQILNLPPFRLDKLFEELPLETSIGGYDLMPYPYITIKIKS